MRIERSRVKIVRYRDAPHQARRQTIEQWRNRKRADRPAGGVRPACGPPPPPHRPGAHLRIRAPVRRQLRGLDLEHVAQCHHPHEIGGGGADADRCIDPGLLANRLRIQPATTRKRDEKRSVTRKRQSAKAPKRQSATHNPVFKNPIHQFVRIRSHPALPVKGFGRFPLPAHSQTVLHEFSFQEKQKDTACPKMSETRPTSSASRVSQKLLSHRLRSQAAPSARTIRLSV